MSNPNLAKYEDVDIKDFFNESFQGVMLEKSINGYNGNVALTEMQQYVRLFYLEMKARGIENEYYNALCVKYKLILGLP